MDAANEPYDLFNAINASIDAQLPDLLDALLDEFDREVGFVVDFA